MGQALDSGRVPAVRAALREVEALPAELRGPALHVAVARTYTLEQGADLYRLALACLPCQPSLAFGDLDVIEPELLDPSSALLSACPDAVLVLWRLEELHPRLVREGNGWTADERREAVELVSRRMRSLCEGFARVSPAPLFLSTLAAPQFAGRRLPDVHQPFGLSWAVHRLNADILELASSGGQVRAVDFSGWAAGLGAQVYDPKMEFFARQYLSAAGTAAFASELAHCLRPLVVPGAKVLALDLDNTLWGGILGEDGISGLKIGHDFPGNVYMRIQRLALGLKNRGALLALLSKNNLEDVREAFAAIPDMPLRLDDFAAVRVNWEPKHENLSDIARELNVGTDAFVFVDDQAFERESMVFHLPEVHVLDVTGDPLGILAALDRCCRFDSYSVSAADAARVVDYQRQCQRRELELGSATKDDFLHSLGLAAVVSPVRPETLPRVVQMLAKTNQFNATTRRHGEAAVRGMMRQPGAVLLTLSLSDRFGDQGIVGLAMALPGEREGTAVLDSFLLSCRALGRGAEQALWSVLLERLQALGLRALEASYLPTAKNAQVADLFDRLGMALVSESDGRRDYSLSLPVNMETPPWIQVAVQEHA